MPTRRKKQAVEEPPPKLTPEAQELLERTKQEVEAGIIKKPRPGSATGRETRKIRRVVAPKTKATTALGVKTPTLSQKQKERLIEVEQRQERAVEMRSLGLSYGQIAEALGYSNRSSAQDAVLRYIERQGFEPSNVVVSNELRKLDRMENLLWRQIMNGDVSHIPVVLRIMEMRARYTGLDNFIQKNFAETTVNVVGGVVAVQNGQQPGVLVISGQSEQEYVSKLAQATGITPDEIAAIKEKEDKASRQRENRAITKIADTIEEMPLSRATESVVAIPLTQAERYEQQQIIEGEVVHDNEPGT
jgi:hypothetical protein